MDVMDQMVTDLTCALEDTTTTTTTTTTTLMTKTKKIINNIPPPPPRCSSNSTNKSGNNRAAAWAHRRSRSTSHLNLPSSQSLSLAGGGDIVHKSESEDTSKEGGNDSDDAERSLAKLSIQNHTTTPKIIGGSNKSLKHSRTCSMPLTKQSIVESDSVNELFSPTQPPHRVQTTHSKRPRRRHKRMAVELSDNTSLIPVTERDLTLPCSSRTAGGGSSSTMGPPFLKTAPVVICKVSSYSRGGSTNKKKIQQSTIHDIRMELIGKRKRSHREKSTPTTIGLGSNSAPAEVSILNSDDQMLSTMDLVNMGMDALCSGGNGGIEIDNDDEIMKSEASSLSSSSDSECHHPSCDEGQEGDDEHSDWVGDEWIDEMDDSERRRNLILKRLLDYGDSREIRAGKRKGYPNKPIFSIRTSANEQLSKFLQNSEQSELKLHPMRKEERVQLSHLASLYSLQMHCIHEPHPSGLTCPVLTKTSNTTKMDNLIEDKNLISNQILSESDTKRIKM